MYLTEAIFINTLQVHLQFSEKADLFAKFNEEQISNEIFRDIKRHVDSRMKFSKHF